MARQAGEAGPAVAQYLPMGMITLYRADQLIIVKGEPANWRFVIVALLLPSGARDFTQEDTHLPVVTTQMMQFLFWSNYV